MRLLTQRDRHVIFFLSLFFFYLAQLRRLCLIIRVFFFPNPLLCVPYALDSIEGTIKNDWTLAMT